MKKRKIEMKGHIHFEIWFFKEKTLKCRMWGQVTVRTLIGPKYYTKLDVEVRASKL